MKDENDRIVDSPEYYLKEFKDNKRFGEEWCKWNQYIS
jgi:hypothetical protein